MTDSISVQLRVDDIDGRGQEYYLVGRDRFGLPYLPVSLVPRYGQFQGARYRATIHLSKGKLDDETTVTDDRTTITAPFTCESLDAESWFEIQTDRGAWQPALTLPRTAVPDWISAAVDTGSVRIELTYDHELTVANTSLSPKRADLKRETFDPTTPGVRVRWTIDRNLRVNSLSVAGSHLFVGSYSQGRDDKGTGVAAIAAGDGDVDWETELADSGRTYVSAGENTVYAGSRDGTVYALDAGSGEKRWSFDTGGEVLSAPVATPGSQEPAVFVGTLESTVYGLDGSTGTRHWTFEAVDSIKHPPVVSGDDIFCSDGAGLYALDPESGDLNWTYEPDCSIDAESVTVDDARVYLTESEDTLVALDRLTGADEWVREAGHSSWYRRLSVSGDHVYVPTDAGIDGHETETGDVTCRLPGYSKLVAHDGSYYYSTGEDESRVLAAEESSGRLAWYFGVYGISPEQLTAGKETVYLAGWDGDLWALETRGSTQLFVDGRLDEFNGSDDDFAETALSEDGDEVGLLTYPSRYLPYYGDRVGTRFDIVVGVDTDYQKVTDERQRASRQITEFTAEVTDREGCRATLSLTELDGDIDGGRLQVPADRLPEDLRDVGDSGYVSVYLEVDENATPEEAKPDEWY